MTSYKIVKCPLPAVKANEMYEAYKSSKGQPGGFSVRYRIPKQLIQMLGEELDEAKLSGAGGDLVPMQLMLQPRQYEGAMNAKSKNKSYALVLSAKQLKKMDGQGLFSSLAKIAVKAAAPVLAEKVGKKIFGGDGAIEGTEDTGEGGAFGSGTAESDDCDVCDKCSGSGLIPLLGLIPALASPKKRAPPPGPLRRMPRGPQPPPQKNLQGPRVSM